MAAHAPPASRTQLWLPLLPPLLLLTGRSEASPWGVNTAIHPQQPAEGNGSDDSNDLRGAKPIYGGFMVSSAEPETCRVGVRSVCAASAGSCTGRSGSPAHARGGCAEPSQIIRSLAEQSRGGFHKKETPPTSHTSGRAPQFRQFPAADSARSVFNTGAFANERHTECS